MIRTLARWSCISLLFVGVSVLAAAYALFFL